MRQPAIRRRRAAGHRLAWLCLVVLAVFVATVQAAPRAWLDRNDMQLGETVTLNVEVDGSAAAAPDFSALAADFTLLGTQSSTQMSLVNGQASSKTLWAVGLEPRRPGTLEIAPLAVGGGTTPALRLEVRPAAVGSAADGADAFIEVEADPPDPWVQQQVGLSVRLYSAYDLAEGNLAEPQVDGALLRRLGQGRDRTYLATVGGRRYHVYERRYALSPERSGSLEIAPIAFRGRVADPRDPTGFFGRGRQLTAVSRPLALDVRPRPAAAAGNDWLPARALGLEDLAELPATVRVGEPLTRRIRLTARGLAGEQLPDLELAAPPGASLYPDQAETSSGDDGEWLTGERTRSFALVPGQPGTLVVPGLRVHWWDVVHGRMATAELPERKVRVLPASAAVAGDGGRHAAVADAQGDAALPFSAAAPAGSAAQARARLWQWLAAGALLLWLATLALWWWHGRAPGRPRPAAGPTEPPSARSARAAFLGACALGDAAAAERWLIAWAGALRPGLRSLGELGGVLGSPLQRELVARLERARYGDGDGSALGPRLAEGFRHGIDFEPSAEAEPVGSLPPLHPRHRPRA